MPKFIEELEKTSSAWNENSYDRVVFQTLIIESDLVVEKVIGQIIPILKANLQVTKDAETRTKFLILLSQVILKCDQIKDSGLSKHFDTIINDMILINVVWQAGRTATAIRMTAVAALLTLVQSDLFLKSQVFFE